MVLSDMVLCIVPSIDPQGALLPFQGVDCASTLLHQGPLLITVAPFSVTCLVNWVGSSPDFVMVTCKM